MATTPLDPEAVELYDAIIEVEDAEQHYLEAEGRRKKARERLVEIMALQGLNETTVEEDGEGYKVKVISAERVTIHDDVLVEVLGKRAYNSLTERKASKDKVLAAIREGKLDPAAVSSAIEIKRTSAWPRIDRYVPDHDEDDLT